MATTMFNSSSSLRIKPASQALPLSFATSSNRSRAIINKHRSLPSFTPPRAAVVEPGEVVLVAGATGGVGQLVTAKLLEVR